MRPSASRGRRFAAAARAKAPLAAPSLGRPGFALLGSELVDRAVERDRVELARGVLAERREARDLEGLAAHAAAQLPVHRAQAPDRPFAIVAVEVASAGRGHSLAAVDVAARDRAALAVGVGHDREDERPARVRLLAVL